MMKETQYSEAATQVYESERKKYKNIIHSNK